MIPLVRELQLFPFERAIIQPVDPQPVIVHALLVTEELETVVTVLAARVVNRPLEGWVRALSCIQKYCLH